MIFAAIDVRPYAFAALAINCCILTLVALRRNDSSWLAALFGLSAACIVQFQLLFAVILPALAICFVALKIGNRKVLWRQFAVALVVFAIAAVPVIPRLRYMAQTSATHVFAEGASALELGSTLTLKGLAGLLVVAVLVAAATRRLDLRTRIEGWPILLCSSLALIPILTLFFLSRGTAIHVFVPRYRLVCVPGIALCWALVATRIDSRALRLMVCIAAVAATTYFDLTNQYLRQHQYSWKHALVFVEKNTATDHAPVVMCSDIPESDHMVMPVSSAIAETGILPPLSYYTLTVQVTPLPRSFNAEAVRAGSEFLREAAARHQRFLAMGFLSSGQTLKWLQKEASATDSVRELGEFDGVKVLEFKPLP